MVTMDPIKKDHHVDVLCLKPAGCSTHIGSYEWLAVGKLDLLDSINISGTEGF